MQIIEKSTTDEKENVSLLARLDSVLAEVSIDVKRQHDYNNNIVDTKLGG